MGIQDAFKQSKAKKKGEDEPEPEPKQQQHARQLQLPPVLLEYSRINDRHLISLAGFVVLSSLEHKVAQSLGQAYVHFTPWLVVL